jgi:hypothetical protein
MVLIDRPDREIDRPMHLKRGSAETALDGFDAAERLGVRFGVWRKRLAATSGSCLILLVLQLLIEVALIDLEAGQIQRFG